MWVVHQEGTGNTFTCESCGYSTRDKKLYKNHLMNLHDIGDHRPGTNQRLFEGILDLVQFDGHGQKNSRLIYLSF